MAGQKSSVWGIDIGQCALKAVRLGYDSKADKAVAQAFDYIEHPKILSQPDADPDELIRAALEKFVSRNDVAGSEVYISVPGQAGLSRFVKLPPVEAKKVPDIVQFEAKQQIPFSLEDVVWDYQRIGGEAEDEGSGPIEAEVGIFAIKKETVRKHLEPFEAKNIDVHVVQLAPVALYNFAAFDIVLHAEAARAKEEGAEEEEGDTIVVLDIGADKTDVVITDGDSIWLRNLPIGGNHFTRALTKELKLTFAKAEHLKRNATKAPDPKKLYQAMRPVFQDFVSELQRSIGFFASTHRGSVIRKIIGMGNGFRLPGLQKFLQQNLQYKIEKIAKFEGMTGEEIITAPAFSENIMSFCVAYGLALQGLHQTPIQTNLLPNEIKSARLIRDKKPWALLAASILLLGFAGYYVSNFMVLRTVNKDTFKTKVEEANRDSAKYNKYKTDFDAAKNKFKQTNDAGMALVDADRVAHKDQWLKAVQFLSRALPERRAVDPSKITAMEEVNIDAVRAVYFPALNEWFVDDKGPAKKEARDTMAEKDKNAPPQGPGWVFQIKGYTFNAKEYIFLTQDVLRRFQQAPEFSHAVLVEYQTKADWTPSSGPIINTLRTIGPKQKGGSSGSFAAPTSIAPTVAAPKVGEDRHDGLPEDMKKYLEESEDKNRTKSGSNKITRTDFVIELVWKGPAVPAAAAPGTMPGTTPVSAAGTAPLPTPGVVPSQPATPPVAPPVTAQPTTPADSPPQAQPPPTVIAPASPVDSPPPPAG